MRLTAVFMSLLGLLCQQQAFLSLWAPQCSCHDLYTTAGSSFIPHIHQLTLGASVWMWADTSASHCSGQEVYEMKENAGRISTVCLSDIGLTSTFLC